MDSVVVVGTLVDNEEAVAVVSSAAVLVHRDNYCSSPLISFSSIYPGRRNDREVLGDEVPSKKCERLFVLLLILCILQ